MKGKKPTDSKRSAVVSVRLDPMLRFAAELAARTQRRTVSSFIEWAVEQAVGREYINEHSSIAEAVSQTWDVDDADRLAKLALNYPGLLTHHEQILWKLIKENGCLWKGSYGGSGNEWSWFTTEETLNYKRLREHWDLLNKVASGEESVDELPKWKVHPDVPVDEDIPF